MADHKYSKKELVSITFLIIAMMGAGLYTINMVAYNKHAINHLAERKEYEIRLSEENKVMLQEALEILREMKSP